MHFPHFTYLEVYLTSIAVCLVASWCVQMIKGAGFNDKPGFEMALGVMAFIPVLNTAITMCVVGILLLAILCICVALPSIIQMERDNHDAG